MRVSRLPACVLTLAAVLHPGSAGAQSAVRGPRRVALFGYIQTQLERTHVEGEDSRDRVFFRRLVLGLRAKPARTWAGQFQIDLGPLASSSTTRILVKDAFLQYSGVWSKGITLEVGNQKLPFSRSALTSAQRRGLVERPFTGEKSYGSPGRLLGIKAESWFAGHRVYWAAAAGSSFQSPDVHQIRVDAATEAHAGWRRGILSGGRIEIHPRGETPRDQGLSHQPLRFTVGGGAWRWNASGDSAPHPLLSAGHAQADRSDGVEISGGLRGGAVSIDAEYERIAGHTADPTVTAGLFRQGAAHLRKVSFEGGYMLRGHLEVVGGWDRLFAAAYTSSPHRPAAGVNWYPGHNLKMQLMHREIENDGGVPSVRAHVTYLQAQFAF